MSKHTPGPWFYQEESDAYTHIVRGENGRFVCQLPQDATGLAEANARLIAAAPDLLDACRAVGDPQMWRDWTGEVLWRGVTPDGNEIETRDPREILRAAIAKATQPEKQNA